MHVVEYSQGVAVLGCGKNETLVLWGLCGADLSKGTRKKPVKSQSWWW